MSCFSRRTGCVANCLVQATLSSPPPSPPPPQLPFFMFRQEQAFFIGVQIEVEDAEVMPFPTTRQTLQEMLLDEEEKDFWDDAELAPAQESAMAGLPSSALRRDGGDEKDSEGEEAEVAQGKTDSSRQEGQVESKMTGAAEEDGSTVQPE